MKKERTSAAATRPEGSIFAGTRAEHGDYVLAMWRFAQKLSRSQTVALTGLDKDTVTKLYHSLRLAALDTTMDLDGGRDVGGRRPGGGDR